jgi:hypothetical protein
MVQMSKQDHKPTGEEITRELALLEQYKTLIPQRSAFGDENRAQIDAQIDVLKNNLTDAQITWQYDADETAEEYQDGDQEIYQAADYARQWLDGVALDGAMSADWFTMIPAERKPKGAINA